MCARRPTCAMPKPFLCCERAFCCSMVVMWPVLMHVMSFDAMWLLVLCHVTWCNAMSCDVRSCDAPCNGHVVCSKWFCDNVVIQRTILYYKVLLQCYSVLQSTTPVLLCTTLYYKVLLQYYSVLQSTTPVLLCTTQYYNVLLQYYTVLQSTTPVLLCTAQYYNVLLQYYSVLQSTPPVLLCTAKYYSSTTPVLLCTTKYYSSTTLYYKVLLQYYSVLQRTTPVLLCTTKYYSSTTLYCKVLLKYCSSTTLYYKVLLQYYSVLQSTTPVLLCTTKYSNRILLCTAKYYSSTTLYYKAAFMIDPCHIWNVIYNARSNRTHPPTSPNTAPATQIESHDWSAWQMKRHLQCAEQQESSPNFTKYCACHAKWISWLIRIRYETSFTMRGAAGIIPQLHQILRLPRKMNLMIDPHNRWNVIYNARSNKSHPPTSANTAPATKSLSSRLQRKLSELLPPI